MDTVDRDPRRCVRMDGCWICFLLLVAILMAPVTSVAARQNGDAGTGATSGVTAMLEKVPLKLPGLGADDLFQGSYADVATQLAVTGTERPDSIDSPGLQDWIAATAVTPTPSYATQFLAQWRELFGFDLFQADETLEISSPPFNLTLYEGEFDEDAVVRALDDLGYEAVDVDGAAVFAIRDDYEIDIRSPAGFVLATMNVAAILPDGTLVFAPAMEIIEAVVAVAAGDRESLAEGEDAAALLSHLPADLVGATLVPGIALRHNPVDVGSFVNSDATPDVNAMATEIATPNEMPPVLFAVLGTTAGGSPSSGTPSSEVEPAGAVAVLLMQRSSDAETAVPVIEERLKSGESLVTRRPFLDIFADYDVEAIPGEAIVSIDLVLGDAPPNILIKMLYQRDLGFIAW